MLYVSKKLDTNNIEIIDTNTNQVVVEPIKTLYCKYHNKVVEGLTYSPKRKQPRIEVTSPVWLMLKRIPVGQVILFKRNEDLGYEHCLVIRHNSESLILYGGGGKLGTLVLTKSTVLKNSDFLQIDISHVDTMVATRLKQEYKEYTKTKK